MLFMRLYESNLKGIINLYLKSLPQTEQDQKELEEKEIGKAQDINVLSATGDWLKFASNMLKNDGKDFTKLMPKLSLYGLKAIMLGCIYAGAFMYHQHIKQTDQYKEGKRKEKPKIPFFIREIFKPREKKKKKAA